MMCLLRYALNLNIKCRLNSGLDDDIKAYAPPLILSKVNDSNAQNKIFRVIVEI